MDGWMKSGTDCMTGCMQTPCCRSVRPPPGPISECPRLPASSPLKNSCCDSAKVFTDILLQCDLEESVDVGFVYNFLYSKITQMDVSVKLIFVLNYAKQGTSNQSEESSTFRS